MPEDAAAAAADDDEAAVARDEADVALSLTANCFIAAEAAAVGSVLHSAFEAALRSSAAAAVADDDDAAAEEGEEAAGPLTHLSG